MSDTHLRYTLAPLAGPNKGGRPKIDPAAVRSLNLSVRLSPAEYAALRERADQLGMKPGQFLRQAGLTRRLPPPPVPAVNREEWAKLGQLANNINQLTRRANAGQLPGFPAATVTADIAPNSSGCGLTLLGLSGDTP